MRGGLEMDERGDEVDAISFFLERFIAVVTVNEMTWRFPSVFQSDEDDTVEFEWWSVKKKGLFISAYPSGKVEYLKIWGVKDGETEEGEDPSDEQLVDFWKWLHTD